MQDYLTKIHEEKDRFKRLEDVGTLNASIMPYYGPKYRWPRLKQVCGARSHIYFYVNRFAKQLRKPGTHRLLSIGCGDAQTETQVASIFKKNGLENFVFDCIDLSDAQIDRAKAKAKQHDVLAHFNFEQADFNFWSPSSMYEGVMAHYVLHHVVELEHLVSAIKGSMVDDAVFLTMDVVGRNGHQRWPETLEIIQYIWRMLPEEKRYHRFLKKTYDEFLNWDCSKGGFEGIRSQDILPLLVKEFGFESFLAMGGIIEIFIGPGYGNNFDPESAQDRAFIDFVQFLNDLLIDLGYIKPTQIFAVMTKHRVAHTKVFRNWTPEFCLRPTTMTELDALNYSADKT